MNNMSKKMMMTGIACVALCGTTLAAPQHNTRPMPKSKAPITQIAKSMPKPAHHHAAKAPFHHHAVRPAHHMPPPSPRYCRHNRHECHECHHNVGGATLLGAIVGGIIDAIAS